MLNWINGFARLLFGIAAAGAVVFVIVEWDIPEKVVTKISNFGKTEAEIRQSERAVEKADFAERQKRCVAYYIWHVTIGSNKLKRAGKLAEWRTFIALWHAVHAKEGGRPPCTVFGDAEIELPALNEEYRWQDRWDSALGQYYWEWKLKRETDKDKQYFEDNILKVFGLLIETKDLDELKRQIPPSLLADLCIRKVIRSDGGGFTTVRPRISRAQLKEGMNRYKYEIHARLPSPVKVPKGQSKPPDYLFYCPKK